MIFYVEADEGIDADFPFDVEETVRRVAGQVLKTENCPCEASVNVLLTDNDGIREFNRQYRDMDRETDVLSFPNLDFETAGKFDIPKEKRADCFDPETGELLLGDIILSVDRVREQAESYGHSQRREFAFLVAHSMLHLCGYDHMEEAEAKVMEEKQEAALTELGITRD